MRRGARIASLALACGLAVLACERGGESTAAPAAGAAVAASEQPATGGRGNPVVLIQTSKGTLKVELDAEHAPISVKNFLAYADAGFYDGTIFHRVIDGFMIQGGGFTPDMTQKPTSAPIKNEAGNGLQNRRGTLAMARTSVVDSATAQFFINLTDNDFLNHGSRDFGYAVFGRVVEGMDVVDAIAKVPTGRKGSYEGVPSEPVVIQSVKRAPAS
jgi:peptidyl-prolyl cis-trans isomerase A (cyclophilin A)